MDKQKGFVSIIGIIALVVIVLATGGGIYYTTSKKSQKINEQPQPAQEATRSQEITPSSTLNLPSLNVVGASPETGKPVVKEAVAVNNISNPIGAYKQMKSDFDAVKTYQEFVALSLKYGSKAQVDKINKNQAQLDSMSSEFKQSLVDMLAKGSPVLSQITVIVPKITGNIAILTMKSAKPTATKGTAKLVLENGVWKLDSESWGNK